MNFRRRRTEELDINITPLIDVVFLLLIFFMVSTTFDHQSELNIDLPEADGEMVDKESKNIEISIDASGKYFVNEKALLNSQVETLMKQLSQIAGENKDPRIVISADKNTPHQAVMSAMDAARRLNYSHLTFAAVESN